MKRMILVFLMLCGVCFGTDYYVGTTGTDDGAAGRGDTAGDPWATVSYAINTGTAVGTHTINVAAGTYGAETYLRIMDTSNSKTLTITGAGAGSTILQYTDGSIIYFANALTAVDLTFEDLKFVSSATTCFGLRLDAACDAVDLAFTDCIIDMSGSTNGRAMTINTTGGATTRNIAFTGGQWIGGGTGHMATLYDCGNITLSGINITHTKATEHVALVGYSQKELIISGCTITSTSSGYACYLTPTGASAISAMTSATVNGSTLIGGSGILTIGISGVTYPIYYYDNTHTNMDTYGIFLGANTDENIDDLGYIYISNNSITKAAGTAGHGMLIGKGVVSGEISNNFVDVSADSGEFAIVSKANNVTFTGNICTGDHALLAKGSQNVTFKNNTCIGTSDEALEVFNDPASGGNPEKATSGCLFVNNIFDGTDGDWSVVISADTELKDCIFDYNCYYGGTSLFSVSTVAKTFTETKAWWVANGSHKINRDNMINGLNVDPQLDANYRPHNPQVIEGGKPDANGNKSSMGAISPPLPKKGVYGFQKSTYGGN